MKTTMGTEPTWQRVAGESSERSWSRTERLDVPGGWLYRTTYWVRDREGPVALDMAFVPYPAISPPQNP